MSDDGNEEPRQGQTTTALRALAQKCVQRTAPPWSTWAHRRYWLFHPLHLLLLGSWTVIGLASRSLWMLLPVAAIEAMFLGVLPRVRWMRRAVERRWREQRRQEAAHRRAALMGRMDACHTGELRELERRIASARAHAASVSESMEALLDDEIDLDGLVDAFVRLSVASRIARESLAMSDRNQLVSRINELEQYRRQTRSARLRGLATREIGVLQQRIACLRRNEEDLEALSHDLAAIAAACRLVHERALSLVSRADETSDVERLVAEAQLHDEALGEVDSPHDAFAPVPPVRVRSDEEPVDLDGARAELRAAGEDVQHLLARTLRRA